MRTTVVNLHSPIEDVVVSRSFILLLYRHYCTLHKVHSLQSTKRSQRHPKETHRTIITRKRKKVGRKQKNCRRRRRRVHSNQ